MEAEKERRGRRLLARLDEREGRGVVPRVSKQRGQLWVHTGESPSAGERESTSGARTRELDNCVLHRFKRERVPVIDVGKKLFVGLLVAGRVREVDAHESDECVNVGTVTVFMWQHRGVNDGDVVGRRRRGIVLESEARLETASEKLVRDGGACDRVKKENFRPGCGATFRRAPLPFSNMLDSFTYKCSTPLPR